MTKWLKIPLIIVGSILLLLVLLSCLAGPIAKNYAEKHSVELCHRKATIEKVRVNIFNGSVLIDKLIVLEEDAKTPFLSFNQLKVNASLPMLLKKTVRLTEIGLDGLDATVIQNGNRFNFTDVIELYTNKPDKEEKDTTPSQWTIDLRNIKISNSDIQYKDAQVGSHFGLKDIAITVPQLRFSGGDSDINLDLDFDEGGKLGLNLLYDIQQGKYNLKLQMSKFQINAIQPYLVQSFNFDNLKGVLNGNILAKGSLQHILDMDVSGNFALENVKVDNADKTPLLSFARFSADVDKANLQNMDFHLKNVLLSNLDFHYDNFRDGNTLSRLMKPKSKTEDTKNDTVQSKPLNYLIDNLTVTNGRITYNDHTLYDKMSFPVKNINLVVQNLQSGASAQLSLDASLGQSGTLKCSGNVNPMDLSNAKLQLAIENLAIKEFSPYSSYYLAYPITNGLLSFKSDDVIKSNWLKSENSLDIFKPTFGDKQKNIKPAAANIPMKAAMYVLTDRKGHVKMDLPVTGDISSPEFSFKKIIWKTFVNLIVKIAASPIDFVSHIAGDNTFKPIQLAVDQPQLSMEDRYQLNDMAKVLLEKSEMQLSVQVGCGYEILSDETPKECPKENVFNQLVNYLESQNIPASRIVLDSASDVKAPEGKVNVLFNLSIPE